jgi:hypothetical protein
MENKLPALPLALLMQNLLGKIFELPCGEAAFNRQAVTGVCQSRACL